MKKIRKMIHQHYALNKYNILRELEINRREFKIHDSTDLLQCKVSDGMLRIYYFDTGEEYSVPFSIIISLNSLDLRDYYSSKCHYEEDQDDKYLVVLHTLATSYYDYKCLANELRVVLSCYLGRDSGLDTKWLRDEIYDSLGIVVGYITYSSPTEYEFY